MSKQTAVEWLIEKISEKQPNGFYVIDTLEDVAKTFDQAKAMEREQMGEVFDESRLTNQWCILTESAFQYKSFEDYYNETYKGGEQ